MTRIQFNRYVETPASVVFMLSALLWVYTSAWGNTLGGFELSIKAFGAGGVVGLIGALLFAPSHADLISGMFSPGKRIASFCIAALFLCGIVTAAFSLAVNRFLPAGPEANQIFSVSQSHKIKGGWSVTFRDSKDRFYEHSFGNNFGPVPVGARFQFRIQIGVLGYPYFHTYKRIS